MFNSGEAQNVAEGLELLTPSQLESVHQVTLEETANPGDSSPLHPAGFVSKASAYNGAVQVWHPFAQDANSTMMSHEAAHLMQTRLGLTDQQWEEEIKKDKGLRPSDYAATNAKEDFAEFVEVYVKALGGPCEARLRARYPNEFKKLADLLAKDAVAKKQKSVPITDDNLVYNCASCNPRPLPPPAPPPPKKPPTVMENLHDFFFPPPPSGKK